MASMVSNRQQWVEVGCGLRVVWWNRWMPSGDVNRDYIYIYNEIESTPVGVDGCVRKWGIDRKWSHSMVTQENREYDE